MNDPNHYEKIEGLIRNLRRTTDAQLDEEILDDALATVEEEIPRRTSLQVFVIGATKIAAAAVILVVLVIAAQKYFAGKKVQPPITEVAQNESVAAIEDSNKTVIPAEAVEAAPPKQDTVNLEDELKQIILLISANDTNGLAKALSDARVESRLAAAIYLANMNSRRSVEILDILSSKLGSQEPNNLFAVTSAVLKKRLEGKKNDVNQPPPEKKEGKKEEIAIGCVLSGFVSDAETGKPIRDVNICLEGNSTVCAITDVNGFYCFDKKIEQGEYRIAIHSKEYIDANGGNRPITSLRNDSNTVENFALTPACMIDIEIVNEANEPLKGAFVYEAWSVSYEEPNKESHRFGTADYADENGKVMLGGFESSEEPRTFIATYNDYAPESLTVVLNNRQIRPFYRMVIKRVQDIKADSNQPPQ